jgi:hypothetical protein
VITHAPGSVTARVQIEIDQPTAGRAEALVEAAKLGPQRLTHEDGVALVDRAEPAIGRGEGKDRDVEQPIAVLGPAHLLEQAVLGCLAIALGHGVHLQPGAEMKAEREDHRARGEAVRHRRVLDEPGRGEARAVDEHADHFAARLCDRAIERARRRRIGLSRGDADHAQIGAPLPAGVLVEGLRRAVVDNDDLVIGRRHAALHRRRQRANGARQLARHVVAAHDQTDTGSHRRIRASEIEIRAAKEKSHRRAGR